jgi:hypothetical protein
MDQTPDLRWVNSAGGVAESYLSLSRRSKYTRHFPEERSRLTQVFEDSPTSIPIAAHQHTPGGLIHFRERAPLPKPDLFLPSSAALTAYFTGNTSPQAIQAADQALSIKRFAHERGKRIVTGWDAQYLERAHQMMALASATEPGQRYFTFMFNLWRLYYEDSFVAVVSRDPAGANLPWAHKNNYNPDAAPVVHTNYDHIPAAVTVTCLSAVADITVQPVVNPEGAFWTDLGGVNAVIEGTAAFIDVEGMTDDMIRLTILAMAPAAASHRRHFVRNGTNYECVVGGWGGDNNSPDFRNVRTGVLNFFLHFGNRPAPSQATANATYLGRGAPNHAQSPWNRLYRRADIATLMRHFCTKHHAWSDCWAAYDAVTYRAFTTAPALSPAAGSNTNDGVVAPFGSNELYLPSNRTLPAYFDCFRRPMLQEQFGSELADVWALTPRRFIWHAQIACHALAASITWATRAFSISGEVINSGRRGAGFNEYETNHITAFTLKYFDESISPFVGRHFAAMRLIYGFRPTDSTSLTTHMWPAADICHAVRAPFLASAYHDMWAVKLLPRSYILPLPHSRPSWPKDVAYPNVQIDDAGQVRVARDTEAFTGRAWVQDGGQIANLQYYLSAGLQDGYRFEATGANSASHDLHAHSKISHWHKPFGLNHPDGWDYRSVDPISYGPRGSPFADYLAPTILTYRVRENRILAYGSRISPRGVSAAATRHVKHAWFDSYTGGTPQCVSVTYRHPLGFRFESEPVNDYSMLVYNTTAGDFDHIGFVTHASLRTLEPPQVRTSLGDSSAAMPPMASVPVHLANAPIPASNPFVPLVMPQAPARRFSTFVPQPTVAGPVAAHVAATAEARSRDAEVQARLATTSDDRLRLIEARIAELSAFTPPPRPPTPRNDEMRAPTPPVRRPAPPRSRGSTLPPPHPSLPPRPAAAAYIPKNPNTVEELPPTQQAYGFINDDGEAAMSFEPTIPALSNEGRAFTQRAARPPSARPAQVIGGMRFASPRPLRVQNPRAAAGITAVPNDSAARDTQQQVLQGLASYAAEPERPQPPSLDPGPSSQFVPRQVAAGRYRAPSPRHGPGTHHDVGLLNEANNFRADSPIYMKDLSENKQPEDFSSGNT